MDVEAAAPALEDQWREIEVLRQQNIAEGETWYVVDGSWFKEWEAHVKSDGPKPGPVDNSSLFLDDDHTRLKPGLSTPQQVQVLPAEAWNKLCTWYGNSNDSIPRQAVNYDPSSNLEVRVELYPATFICFRAHSLADQPATTTPTFTLPGYTTLGQLSEQVYKAVDVSPQTSRIYIIAESDSSRFYSLTRPHIELENAVLLDPSKGEQRLTESALGQNCYAVVDQQEADGSWSLDSPQNGIAPLTHASQELTLSQPNALLSQLHSERNQRLGVPTSSSMTRAKSSPLQASKPRGLTGLSNLGNTCFMNSALQCLSNTAELTRYFVSGVWRVEINRTNPLGMHGAVAESYGNLVEKVWSGTSNSFAPREFKQTIGRFAPSFSGYAQQDSQEFLAFLLDGLHEDLNRILKKPYTETPDIDSTEHSELVRIGNECWDMYKRRNDSVIVDLFQGQYKSTLICPECQKVSITFDPFMYLTLPIPMSTSWKHKIHVVPYDTTKSPLKMTISMKREGSMKLLKAKVAELAGMDAKRLVAVEIFSQKVYKIFRDDDQVLEIRPDDIIYMHEMRWPVPALNQPKAAIDEDHLVILVMNRYLGSARDRERIIGYPLPLCLTKDEASSVDKIYAEVTALVQRFTSTDLTKVLPLGKNDDDKVSEGNESEAVPMSTDGEESSMDLDIEESLPSPLPSRSHFFNLRLHVASLRSYRKGPFFADFQVNDNTKDLASRLDAPQMSRNNSAEQIEEALDEHGGSTDDEDSTAAKIDRKTSEAAPAEEAEPTPLLSSGDILVCDWDNAQHEAAFGAEIGETEASRSLWDQYDSIEDPSQQSDSNKVKRTLTIEDCLQEFIKEEELGEEDLWYCPRCKKHQQATKKFDLWKLPDILVVHLKRFSSSRLYRDKITALVDFPLQGLDLKYYVQGIDDSTDQLSYVYDLYAVDNHMGMLGGGHYTSYAQNPDQQKWYLFDDSSVREVDDLSDLVSPNAYLLFFRRRSVEPLGGVSSQKTAEAEALASLNPSLHSAGTAATSEGSPASTTSTSSSSLSFGSVPKYPSLQLPRQTEDDEVDKDGSVSPVDAEPGSSDGGLSSDGEADKHSEFDGYLEGNVLMTASISDAEAEDTEGIGRQMLKRRTRSPDAVFEEQGGHMRQSPKRDVHHTHATAPATATDSVGFTFGNGPLQSPDDS